MQDVLITSATLAVSFCASLMIGAMIHPIRYAIVEFRAKDRLPDMIEVYREALHFACRQGECDFYSPCKNNQGRHRTVGSEDLLNLFINLRLV